MDVSRRIVIFKTMKILSIVFIMFFCTQCTYGDSGGRVPKKPILSVYRSAEIAEKMSKIMGYKDYWVSGVELYEISKGEGYQWGVELKSSSGTRWICTINENEKTCELVVKLKSSPNSKISYFKHKDNILYLLDRQTLEISKSKIDLDNTKP